MAMTPSRDREHQDRQRPQESDLGREEACIRPRSCGRSRSMESRRKIRGRKP
jgi:hypothetical protein